MRRLTNEQVDQFLATGHYIMRGKTSSKRTQALRDWHRLQVERATQRKIVALHECAHIVIAGKVGVEVTRVNVDPENPHVITRHPRGRTRAERIKMLQRLVIVDLAPLAFDSAEACADDLENAMRRCDEIMSLRRIGPGDVTRMIQAEALLLDLTERAAVLVNKHRAEIEELADELAATA